MPLTEIPAEKYSVYSVIFRDNSVFHADGDYFSINTPPSRVIDYDQERNIIYLELHPDVCGFIDSVDLKYMTKYATSMLDFLQFSSKFLSSLKRGANGERNVLPVHIRSYTQTPMGLTTDTVCSATLMVNYRHDALIWSAVRIWVQDMHNSNGSSVDENDHDAETEEIVFQDCLLGNELIKI